MKPDVESISANQKSRLRFRFGLKTAIIAFTLVSISFGYVVIWQRQSLESEAWDRDLRNVICNNLATIPAGTSVIEPLPPGGMLSLQNRQLAELREHSLLGGTVRPDAEIASSWSPLISLDVARELADRTPIVVANRLLRHYESGLADYGMNRITSSPGTCDPTSSDPSSIWISDRQDISTVVIIEVRVDNETSRADVRIRHIARPIG